MANVEIELNPIDFVTIGTVGPKGRRMFYLQAATGPRTVSLIIEKEQARALSEAIEEMLTDADKKQGVSAGSTAVDLAKLNMELREPIEPQFRVGQMGLGYDQDRDLIVLVAQELLPTSSDPGDPTDPDEPDEPNEPDLPTEDGVQPGVVRMWATRNQMRALSLHTMKVVRQGRVDPQSNGRLLYYWT